METLDETLDKDDVFGTVEAVKTVSDLFLPMSGKIIEFNENLSDSPESINDSPYDEGWIIKVEVSNPDEMSELLDNNQYKDLLDRRYISKITVYYTLFLIILSLILFQILGFPKFQLFEIDKLVHFVMYFSLTILWGLASENLYRSNFKLMLFAIFLDLF